MQCACGIGQALQRIRTDAEIPTALTDIGTVAHNRAALVKLAAARTSYAVYVLSQLVAVMSGSKQKLARSHCLQLSTWWMDVVASHDVHLKGKDSWAQFWSALVSTLDSWEFSPEGDC